MNCLVLAMVINFNTEITFINRSSLEAAASSVFWILQAGRKMRVDTSWAACRVFAIIEMNN